MRLLFRQIKKILFKIFKIIFYWGVLNIILIYYIFFIEPQQLTVKNYKLYNNQLIVDNIKIVHFSDVHVNKWTNDTFLKRIADNINKQNPDIVIFTGDLLDGSYTKEQELKEKEEIIITYLSQINAKYGKFAIIGNHDCSNVNNLKYYKYILEKTNFILLNNENTNNNFLFTINDLNINLFGINTANKKMLNHHIIEQKNNMLNILLLHAPDYINEINIENVNYAFAGHTHGGQVNIPYLNQFILPNGGKQYIKGKYNINNNTVLFVDTGIGTSRIPIRFLMKPQISVYNLEK